MMRNLVRSSAVGLFFASLAAPLGAQSATVGPQVSGTLVKRSLQGPCTTFHGDMRRSGYYESWTGPRSANPLWRVSLNPVDGFGYAQPVVGANGTVYVKDLADVLYAVDANGGVKWQADLGSGATGGGFPPADSTLTIHTELVAAGGGVFTFAERLYATSGDAKLWKLAANGSVLWSVQLPRETSSCSVAIRNNGKIYVTSHDLVSPYDGTLQVYSPNGTLDWSLDTPGQPAINNAPSLDAGGNVLVNGFAHITKYAFDGQGILFDFLASWHNYGSVALDSQGNSYFGSGDGNLYSLDANGSLRWSLQTGSLVTSTPAVTTDGRVLCGSWDGSLYATDANGNQQWSFPAAGAIESSPVVDSQGYAYFVSTDGYLYCLDPSGQQVFSAFVDFNSIGTVAPGKGGRLYVTSASGSLLAFVP